MVSVSRITCVIDLSAEIAPMTDNAVHAAGYIAGILGDLRADADRSSLPDLAYLIAMAESHAKEIALESKGLPRRAPRMARDQRSAPEGSRT